MGAGRGARDETEGCAVGILAGFPLIRRSCLEKMGCYNLSFHVWPGILLLGAEGCIQAPKPSQKSLGQLSRDGSGHGWARPLPERTVRWGKQEAFLPTQPQSHRSHGIPVRIPRATGNLSLPPEPLEPLPSSLKPQEVSPYLQSHRSLSPCPEHRRSVLVPRGTRASVPIPEATGKGDPDFRMIRPVLAILKKGTGI